MRSKHLYWSIAFMSLCGCSQRLNICNLTNETVHFTADAQAGFDENLTGVVVAPCTCEFLTERPVRSGRDETVYSFGNPQSGAGPHLNVTLPENGSFASAEDYYIAYRGERTASDIDIAPPQCEDGVTLCNASNAYVYIFLQGQGASNLLMPGQCVGVEVPAENNSVFNVTDSNFVFLDSCALESPSAGDQITWDGEMLQCTDN